MSLFRLVLKDDLVLSKYSNNIKILLATVFVTLFASSAYGASDTFVKATTLFNKGNQLYRDGKFKSAEKTYIEALGTGIENRNLYYNIGNACFRQKKYGWARLYYEKALLLSPGDRDIKKNMELLVSLLGVEKHANHSSFLAALLSKFLGMLSTSAWIYIVCFFYFTLCAVLVIKLLLRNNHIKHINSALWSVSSLLIIFAFMLGSKLYLGWISSGIVVDKSVAVKSAPKSTDSTLFTLRGGDKVRLYEVRNTWFFINMPGKSSGWVPAKSIKKI